ELGRRRFQGGAPPFQLVVSETDPRALDLEAVVPHVREARYPDPLLHVRQRAAGDDHDVEIGRAGRLIERLAGRLGQLRVSRARCRASATSSTSNGFTSSASWSSSAAPAISESTRTPSSSSCAATYSLATRFMPSRSGVTSATSAWRYSATSSAGGSERTR